MKKYYLLLLFCLSTAFLAEVSAQEQSDRPKAGSLSDISFIEGHWKAMDQGKTIEAIWSAPAGDNMVGFIRMMENGKATLYELFAFEQREAGPVALIKHFKPGLIGLEEKEQSDRYQFVEAEEGRAIFDKEGEELRVLYEKRPDDKFAIALGKLQDGQWVFNDLWEFSRVK